MNRISKITKLLLGSIILQMVIFDYREYDRAYQSFHGTWMDVIGGTAGAPQQYRIAIPFAANFLRIYCNIPLRAGFAGIDLICAAIGIYTLLALFHQSRVYLTATNPGRLLGNLTFLFLVQFYFSWIAWYQRPETMASIAILALSFRLLVLAPEMSKSAARLLAAGGMLILACLQGLVRADVLFAFHVGVLITCMWRRIPYAFTLPRYAQLAISAASACASVLIQYYLMHFVYPRAEFGKVVVIRENLTQPIGWIPFLLFLTPWIFLALYFFRRHLQLDAPNTALFLASAIYVAIWTTAGRIEEVRIFMPYAVALIPLTGNVAIQALKNAPDTAAIRSTT